MLVTWFTFHKPLKYCDVYTHTNTSLFLMILFDPYFVHVLECVPYDSPWDSSLDASWMKQIREGHLIHPMFILIDHTKSSSHKKDFIHERPVGFIYPLELNWHCVSPSNGPLQLPNSLSGPWYYAAGCSCSLYHCVNTGKLITITGSKKISRKSFCVCVCRTSSTIVNYDWLPTSLWAWCVLWNGIIWGLGDHYWPNTTTVLHCKCGIFVSLAKDFSCCIQLHQSSQSICGLFVFWKLELDGGHCRNFTI